MDELFTCKANKWGKGKESLDARNWLNRQTWTQDGREAMVQAGERSRKDAEGSIAESKLYEADRCTHGAGGRAARREGRRGAQIWYYGRTPPWKAEHRRCFKARVKLMGEQRKRDHPVAVS